MSLSTVFEAARWLT